MPLACLLRRGDPDRVAPAPQALADRPEARTRSSAPRSRMATGSGSAGTATAGCRVSIQRPSRVERPKSSRARHPRPVAVVLRHRLHGAFGFTVKDIAGMGVRRISVGGTLARVAMDAFIKSAREIAEQGTFDSFARGHFQCRVQQVLRRAAAKVMTAIRAASATGQPVGSRSTTTPAPRPGPVTP